MRLIVFLFISLLATVSQAQLFENNSSPILTPEATRFVTADEAFPFHAYQEGNQLLIDWQVQPGYYLYQSRMSFTADHIKIKSRDIPEGIPHKDEFFGQVQVYTEPVFVTLTLTDATKNAQITVGYQGCAKKGFCYPPETRVVTIDPTLIPVSNQQTPPSSQPIQNPKSEQGRLADKLSDNLWSIPLFLLLGVGLAFTPCVFPMYPIITSIVLGRKDVTRNQAFKLGLIYVQGMALTYTALGLVVASAGLKFQALLQSPVVLIGFSILFVVLSLSMFGVYTLQMPGRLQTYLNQLSDKQTQGQMFGVFLMGAISGLVCSPCTTAPLSGALLYVAQTGDLFIGGIALYALGLGMGIPLILIAVFGHQFLPRSGPWMEKVKTLFGFILLAAPIFLLERILPEAWSAGLWTTLGICFSIWLFLTGRMLSSTPLRKGMITLFSIVGLCLSALPVSSYLLDHQTQQQAHELRFVRVSSLEALKQQLAQAKSAGQPVMFDLYADWCVACKEFEKYTFSDASVRQQLAHFKLVQADVTNNSKADQEILRSFHILGLPTILFWDAEGKEVSAAKISGFLSAEDFQKNIRQNNLAIN
ncbi:protein-disulfide reductase DsbD [Vibrio aerogenes]|nr:protein-disulfide reductase DsbD [Vibrio aerogenes]